jgi:hypothetical protein
MTLLPNVMELILSHPICQVTDSMHIDSSKLTQNLRMQPNAMVYYDSYQVSLYQVLVYRNSTMNVGCRLMQQHVVR